MTTETDLVYAKSYDEFKHLFATYEGPANLTFIREKNGIRVSTQNLIRWFLPAIQADDLLVVQRLLYRCLPYPGLLLQPRSLPMFKLLTSYVNPRDVLFLLDNKQVSYQTEKAQLEAQLRQVEEKIQQTTIYQQVTQCRLDQSWFEAAQTADYAILEPSFLSGLDVGFHNEQGHNLLHVLVQTCGDVRPLEWVLAHYSQLAVQVDNEGKLPIEYYSENPEGLAVLTAYLNAVLAYPPERRQAFMAPIHQLSGVLEQVLQQGTHLHLLDLLLYLVHLEVDPSAVEMATNETMRQTLQRYIAEEEILRLAYQCPEGQANPVVLSQLNQRSFLFSPEAQAYFASEASAITIPVATPREVMARSPLRSLLTATTQLPSAPGPLRKNREPEPEPEEDSDMGSHWDW